MSPGHAGAGEPEVDIVAEESVGGIQRRLACMPARMRGKYLHILGCAVVLLAGTDIALAWFIESLVHVCVQQPAVV